MCKKEGASLGAAFLFLGLKAGNYPCFFYSFQRLSYNAICLFLEIPTIIPFSLT